MNYTEEITKKINVIDEILDEIEVLPLLKNADFILDEMSIESWLKINMKDKGGKKIPLSLTFTSTEIEIRLDRITEAIDWSNKELKDSIDTIKTIIKNLLTSHILVEYKGPSHTRISLFGKDGKCTNSFKYQEGFSLKKKLEHRLYFPIYIRG